MAECTHVGEQENEAVKFPGAPELRPRASGLGSWTKEALRTLNALCFQKEMRLVTSEVPTPAMFLVQFHLGPQFAQKT